ncbi:hypothetical protein OCU04_004041 [Sclerotinia nivalis]|uniref:Uncharacterized protein n=1 Tax=Sclerotinia nivalis TaxID=352851 RepID=A0A9X0AT53_9HELO|nr:hypothetical protein OCU04_004041 [Sclerotinia nivalis]
MGLLSEYNPPFIPDDIFSRICHRGFPEQTLEEIEENTVTYKGNFDWMPRSPEFWDESRLMALAGFSRELIEAQQNLEALWVLRTTEMRDNLPHGWLLYPHIRWYREHLNEVPVACRTRPVFQASVSGQYSSQASASAQHNSMAEGADAQHSQTSVVPAEPPYQEQTSTHRETPSSEGTSDNHYSRHVSAGQGSSGRSSNSYHSRRDSKSPFRSVSSSRPSGSCSASRRPSGHSSTSRDDRRY